MYEEHPDLPLDIGDAQIVWRYMDLARFMSMLQHQALWFSRADLLGDPHEGAVNKLGKTAWAEAWGAAPGNVDVQQVQWEAMRTWWRVNCWHMNDRESMAMWGLYQQEGRGVAVQSRWLRLKESIIDDNAVHAATVQYINYEHEQVPMGNALLPIVCKRQSFEHENELRLICSAPEDQRPELGPDGEPGSLYRLAWPGNHVSVDLNRLVEAIRLAPESPGWFHEVVQRAAADAGLEAPVVQSALDDPAVF